MADAILSKSICPDGEHHFGAVYDLFYQVVPGTVVWQDNKIAVYDIGQRHHLLDKIAHRALPLLSAVGFSDPAAALKEDACTAGVVDNALSGTRNEEPRIQRNEGASSFTDKNPAQRGP